MTLEQKLEEVLNKEELSQEDKIFICDYFGHNQEVLARSQHWAHNREVEDEISKLYNSIAFKNLSEEDKNTISDYCRKRRVFGHGVYETNSFAGAYYDELHGKAPENPYKQSEPAND